MKKSCFANFLADFLIIVNKLLEIKRKKLLILAGDFIIVSPAYKFKQKNMKKKKKEADEAANKAATAQKATAAVAAESLPEGLVRQLTEGPECGTIPPYLKGIYIMP
jgi:hypothetical protein